MELSSRTGRPRAANPKSVDLKVRLDEKTYQLLLAYCEKHKTTRAETLRKGLDELLSKEK